MVVRRRTIALAACATLALALLLQSLVSVARSPGASPLAMVTTRVMGSIAQSPPGFSIPGVVKVADVRALCRGTTRGEFRLTIAAYCRSGPVLNGPEILDGAIFSSDAIPNDGGMEPEYFGGLRVYGGEDWDPRVPPGLALIKAHRLLWYTGTLGCARHAPGTLNLQRVTTPPTDL
jgi:hypothetical protein